MLFSLRFLRRIVRRVVYPVVEAITLYLLLGRKRLYRQARIAHRLCVLGGRRVLVVAAHPDDETIGCMGVMLMHSEGGDQVRVLMVTDGSGSRAGGLLPTEMAEQRRGEVSELMGLFKQLEIKQLGLVENHWDDGELDDALEQLLNTYRPDIIYAPSCVDFHPEHMKVARVFAVAIDRASFEPTTVVRVYEAQVPIGIELANLYVPLGAHYVAKQQAIDIYRSQRGSLDLWKRQARYLGALYGVHRGAEVFWELSPAGYQAIIARSRWDWRNTPFRSFTGRPFGDFRAYAAGRAARLLLREEGDQRQ